MWTIPFQNYFTEENTLSRFGISHYIYFLSDQLTKMKGEKEG